MPDEQARAMLADKRNKAKHVAKKLLAYLDASAAFMLANGDVIYHRQGYYLMNFQEVFALATKRERALTTNHSCEYFLANQALHLAEFSRYFTSRYDFSLPSLDKLDKDYARLIKSGVSEADLFLPLVCYVGEVLIRQTNGHWDVAPSGHNGAAIIGQDGTEYDPYFCIRKILIDSHKPYAIQAAIASQLLAH